MEYYVNTTTVKRIVKIELRRNTTKLYDIKFEF